MDVLFCIDNNIYFIRIKQYFFKKKKSILWFLYTKYLKRMTSKYCHLQKKKLDVQLIIVWFLSIVLPPFFNISCFRIVHTN